MAVNRRGHFIWAGALGIRPELYSLDRTWDFPWAAIPCYPIDLAVYRRALHAQCNRDFGTRNQRIRQTRGWRLSHSRLPNFEMLPKHRHCPIWRELLSLIAVLQLQEQEVRWGTQTCLGGAETNSKYTIPDREVRSMATLAELAALVDGTIVGDGTLELAKALPIPDSDSKTVTLVDSSKNLRVFEASEAAAAVVAKEYETSRSLIVVKDLHQAFRTLVLFFRPAFRNTTHAGISADARVDNSATIGEGTYVAPGAIVGPECKVGKNCILHDGVQLMEQCVLGDNCQIFPSAILYPQTVLGKRVIIHAGAVIGCHGFGYSQMEGKHIKASQLGWAEIGDDVEIGANSSVDRGVYGPTVIGEGTKIDNFVQIGHNCHIGKHNLLCAHVGIAGSTSTGNYVVMAGQAGAKDHVHIGEKAIVGAQSGAAGDLEGNKTYFGSPAVPRNQKLREVLQVQRLAETNKELKELRARLEILESSQPKADSVVACDSTRDSSSKAA